MLIRSLVAAAVLACCATVAQAGAVFGTSASSSYSFPIVQTGSDSAMDGAPDGTASRFRNNVQESGLQTFTVSWDVTGAGGLIDWRLFVFNRTGGPVNITQVVLTDDSANNATSTNTTQIQTGPVSPGTITTFDLTNYHSQSDYGTVDAGFNWNDVQGIQLTFTLDNPTGSSERAVIQIDAIANPEPTTWALFGLGVLGLGTVVRRRRRRTAAARN